MAVNMLRRHRAELIALGLYVILTIFMLWPMPLQMNTHLIGDNIDAYINPWANWWTDKALRGEGNLYFTPFMFYPYGANLTLHSFSHFNTALWFLFRPLLGTLAAHNLTIVLTYPLSAFGMFALVRYLTRSDRAGFVAGLIFGFSPYHLSESSHPILGTIQWMPLFLLCLIKLIQVKPRRIAHAALAILFACLTALASWHLFVMLAALSATYLVYSLIAERPLWDRRLCLYLIGIGLACLLLLSPLLYPIAYEQLIARTSYLAAPLEQSRGNDLVSFILPSRYHSLVGPMVKPIALKFGWVSEQPAYLGLTAIVLAVLALKARKRFVIYWAMAGLLFVVLSLGQYAEFYGYRINRQPFPWATPIVEYLRSPFRINILISFCLSVLVGWGTAGLLERREQRARRMLTAILSGLIICEFVSVPIPRTPVKVSEFYQWVAQQKDEFALAEIPISRQSDKEYMYYQTLHGKPMVNGHVSRTPPDAYRVVTEIPLLNDLKKPGEPPAWSDRHLLAQLSPLADKNIRYIIFHKSRIEPELLEHWREYFAFPPSFEDDQLVVYQTRPEVKPVARLTPDIDLAWIGLSSNSPSQGETLTLLTVWATRAAPQSDGRMQIKLLDAQGTPAQTTSFPLSPDHPTLTWPAAAAIRGEYSFQIDPHLPPGHYDVVFVPAQSPDAAAAGGSQVASLDVRSLERSFTVPRMEHSMDAQFGDSLTLLGYDLKRNGNNLGIVLHWQALRRMSYYKVFVHLIDVQSGAIVAQNDAAPRQWTYPTDWWESQEMVSDEIVLPSQVPAGRYRIAVGVYAPDTLERLAAHTSTGTALGDQVKLGEDIQLP